MGQQVTFSVRMDKDVKEAFDKVCSELGLTASAAINVFARQMVREKGFPFTPTAEPGFDRDRFLRLFEEQRLSAMSNGTGDMPLDEINEEIEAAREGKKDK